MKLTDEANIKQYGTTDASALALDAGDIDAVIVSSNSALPMLDTFTDLTLLPKDGFDLDPDLSLGMYRRFHTIFPGQD